MKLPSSLNPACASVFPDTVTILTTYRCNAACKQCCFESSPKVRGRLSLEDINSKIDEAVRCFPALKLIVFSGGESFLLKDDLYKAISHATQHGLMVRCVTNAFWGRTPTQAEAVARQLKLARVTEINISTGKDHQEWVPFKSVEHAAYALVQAGINTLVTIEQDTADSRCFKNSIESPILKEILLNNADLFSIQLNSWMPFHENYEERGQPAEFSKIDGGCKQIFHNIVITPYNEYSACCGLTFEHIPELKVGSLKKESLEALFERSISDFLKIWIHIDGPAGIMKKLFGPTVQADLDQVRHICQACAILHQHPAVRNAIRSRYQEFVPEVLGRFNAKVVALSKEQTTLAVEAI